MDRLERIDAELDRYIIGCGITGQPMEPQAEDTVWMSKEIKRLRKEVARLREENEKLRREFRSAKNTIAADYEAMVSRRRR